MQHQRRIAPEQARGVDAQGKVGRDAGLAVTRDGVLRVAIDPGAFHRSLRARQPRNDHQPLRRGLFCGFRLCRLGDEGSGAGGTIGRRCAGAAASSDE